MDRLIEVRETILRLYARYSKIVDKAVPVELKGCNFIISSNIWIDVRFQRIRWSHLVLQ